MILKNVLPLYLLVLLLVSCENKALNEGEGFRPKEIHEKGTEFHFDPVTVDGIEYLILERDNNNPHEGFGFMAFRANKLMEKQDTVLAYLRTINEMQSLLYAKLYNVSPDEAQQYNDELLEKYIQMETADLESLQQSDYSGSTGGVPEDSQD
ncbi:MAG: hypothetical protein KI790_07610 [Cyclobacteriaceae bacterium]|nr:hypothetical protein [Cyclobacteriaceae bacterium HetDA_MAG_MS6]